MRVCVCVCIMRVCVYICLIGGGGRGGMLNGHWSVYEIQFKFKCVIIILNVADDEEDDIFDGDGWCNFTILKLH